MIVGTSEYSTLVNPTHATQQANQSAMFPGSDWLGCSVAECGRISDLTYAKNILPCQITDGTSEIKYSTLIQ